KELRRPHPLTPGGLISDGIEKERELLAEIRSRSDDVIDTSSLTKGDLRNELMRILKGEQLSKLTISICSFGFKHGILSDADLVFDVRFIPNPFYIPELKPLTGETKEVQSYV
ncbi:RNase adaptor protein RapZ, partial [Bacillus licheniformis]